MNNREPDFKNNQSGATAIEYGLIIALVVVAIIGGVTALGTEPPEPAAVEATESADIAE